MIHTAELTYSPDTKLIAAFKNLPDTVYYQQERTWWNSSLRDRYGLTFRIKLVGNKTMGFISPRMICRINFKKVISCNHPEYNHRIDIMTAWDVEEVEQKFNEIMEEFLPMMPAFEFWKVNRIDYCVNVHTTNVNEYIELMKKGDRPYLKDWYDRQGNYTQKPGSLYLVSTAKKKRNRSVTVNFYNKLDETLNKVGVPSEDLEFEDIDSVLELAADVLRLEVQCHKAKTEYLKKKYHMQGKYVKEFLNPEIAYDILKAYIQRITGCSSYHRKGIALELIDKTSYRSETKEKMKQIVNDVAKQHSSIAKVREKYIQEGIMNREEFASLVHKMHETDINPVTIRSNKALPGLRLKDGLPSLLSIFEEAIKNEMRGIRYE